MSNPVGCVMATVVMLLACSGPAHAALACSLASTGPAVVAVGSQRLQPPVSVPDCEGAQVVEGTVVACVQDRRGRLACESFSKGATITQRSLGASGSDRGWLAALWSLLGGGQSTQPAVTRGPDTGLPTGPVLLLAGGIDIDFTAGPLAGATAVEFRQASGVGELIVRVPAIGRRHVDASLFKPGETFTWSVLSRTAAPMASGRFLVYNGPERRVAMAEARRIRTDAASDESAQALMLAAWLQQHDLEYDARAALKRSGFSAP